MSKYVFFTILVSSEGDEKDASHFLLPANLMPREDGISQYQGVPFPNQLGQISSNHIQEMNRPSKMKFDIDHNRAADTENIGIENVSNKSCSVKDDNSKSSTSDEMWLPQPIYPISESIQKSSESSAILRLDNNTKKKNVQSWLQKLTPSKSAKPNTVNNNHHNFLDTHQNVVDYYGGGFGADIKL